MDPVTLFIAQLFGISLLIVSMAMFLRQKEMMLLIDDFLKDRATLFFAALISLMTGLFIVLIHNIWSGGLINVIVTLLGWGLFLRGIVWLFVPGGVLRKLVRGVLKGEQSYFIIVFVIFVISLYLTYVGFTA